MHLDEITDIVLNTQWTELALMEVILFLDFHHEALSIATLGNFHVPFMQFIHSRWELLDLLRLDQRFTAGIFPFYVLLSNRIHGLDL